MISPFRYHESLWVCQFERFCLQRHKFHDIRLPRVECRNDNARLREFLRGFPSRESVPREGPIPEGHKIETYHPRLRTRRRNETAFIQGRLRREQIDKEMED